MAETIDLPTLKYKIGEEPLDFEHQSINVIKNTKYIKFVEGAVGPEVFDRIKRSFLGPFMRTYEKDLKVSAKLVHYILSRQIKTEKKNELWFHFGGQPMRFSIREFHMVTGLRCSGDESVEDTEQKWGTVETKRHTVNELFYKLQRVEPNELDEKYCLGMLVISEAALLSTYERSSFPPEYVLIAKDIQKLESYPWGLLAYRNLLKSLTERIDDGIDKSKYTLYGYVVAFHIWILQSVPRLQNNFSQYESACKGFLSDRFNKLENPPFDKIIKAETKNVSNNCLVFSALF